MFQKLKFYLMSILISAFLGGIIIGANFLVHNIYNLAAGKDIILICGLLLLYLVSYSFRVSRTC